MPDVLTRLKGTPLSVVAGVAAVLLVGNLVLTPDMFAPAQLPSLVNLMIPSVLAAMASAPSVMAGRGGLDLSIGPLLGFVNVLLVGVLLPHQLGGPVAAISILLLVGATVGLLSGVVVAYGRVQPVVVTLGGYLVLTGYSLVVMPQPVGGVPVWVRWLSGSWLAGLAPRSLLLVLAAAGVWVLLIRLGAASTILAVGSLAYALGGLLAALGGIGLSVLIQSGDPTVGRQYTLAAIAAVALGGNQLAGGAGTMTGPVLGALSLFLIQTLLSAMHVSSLWIQIVYGVVLLVALVLNTKLAVRFAARTQAGAAA
jgi:ribose transport system permease protein